MGDYYEALMVSRDFLPCQAQLKLKFDSKIDINTLDGKIQAKKGSKFNIFYQKLLKRMLNSLATTQK